MVGLPAHVCICGRAACLDPLAEAVASPTSWWTQHLPLRLRWAAHHGRWVLGGVSGGLAPPSSPSLPQRSRVIVQASECFGFRVQATLRAGAAGSQCSHAAL